MSTAGGTAGGLVELSVTVTIIVQIIDINYRQLSKLRTVTVTLMGQLLYRVRPKYL